MFQKKCVIIGNDHFISALNVNKNKALAIYQEVCMDDYKQYYQLANKEVHKLFTFNMFSLVRSLCDWLWFQK